MPLTRRMMLTSCFAGLSWPSASWASDVRVLRRYVDGPFGQVHLRLIRSAHPAQETQPPLVCFHYSPGSSRMYQFILPLLAKDRLVMAFDTPGYGNSDPPSEQPAIDDYAEALVSAIKQLTDAQNIDVLGQLTGSFIAIDMAVTHPKLRPARGFVTLAGVLRRDAHPRHRDVQGFACPTTGRPHRPVLYREPSNDP